MRAHAARALRHVAMLGGDAGHDALGRAGALPPLIQLLQAGPADAMGHAVGALQALADGGGADVRHTIATRVASMLGLLAAHEEAKVHASRLLAKLARRTMGAAGGREGSGGEGGTGGGEGGTGGGEGGGGVHSLEDAAGVLVPSLVGVVFNSQPDARNEALAALAALAAAGGQPVRLAIAHGIAQLLPEPQGPAGGTSPSGFKRQPR